MHTCAPAFVNCNRLSPKRVTLGSCQNPETPARAKDQLVKGSQCAQLVCNSIFKLNGTPILKKWLNRFTTVLLFFLSASWAVDARGEDNMSVAVISDYRSYFQGLEAALEFIDTQDVDFILGPGDFDSIEDGYTNYYSIHGYTVGFRQRLQTI
jgi:hypothetical protein